MTHVPGFLPLSESQEEEENCLGEIPMGLIRTVLFLTVSGLLDSVFASQEFVKTFIDSPFLSEKRKGLIKVSASEDV